MERDTRRISYVNCTIIAINEIYFLYLEIAGSSENTAFMISKGGHVCAAGAGGGAVLPASHCGVHAFWHQSYHEQYAGAVFLGDNLERALGRVKYLIFYLLCGVGANVISMMVNMSEYSYRVSAGASGAIFGVSADFVCGDCKPRTTRGSDYPPA